MRMGRLLVFQQHHAAWSPTDWRHQLELRQALDSGLPMLCREGATLSGRLTAAKLIAAAPALASS